MSRLTLSNFCKYEVFNLKSENFLRLSPLGVIITRGIFIVVSCTSPIVFWTVFSISVFDVSSRFISVWACERTNLSFTSFTMRSLTFSSDNFSTPARFSKFAEIISFVIRAIFFSLSDSNLCFSAARSMIDFSCGTPETIGFSSPPAEGVISCVAAFIIASMGFSTFTTLVPLSGTSLPTITVLRIKEFGSFA